MVQHLRGRRATTSTPTTPSRSTSSPTTSTPLFVEDTDNPFFADRIFANRLMNMIDGFRGGAQQNKIYIFDGPRAAASRSS